MDYLGTHVRHVTVLIREEEDGEKEEEWGTRTEGGGRLWGEGRRTSVCVCV